MTIEERKQDLKSYLEQLEEEIETLKENISEVKKNQKRYRRMLILKCC